MGLVTTEAFDALASVNVTGANVGPLAGALNDCKMRLAATDFTPSKRSVVADLVAPTYPTYATQTVVWGVPHRDDEGNIAQHGAELAFVMDDDTVPTQIYGYGLTNAAGSVLLASERFDEPVMLNDELDYLGVIAEFVSSNQYAGKAEVVR